jgi:hypothetical protein
MKKLQLKESKKLILIIYLKAEIIRQRMWFDTKK